MLFWPLHKLRGFIEHFDFDVFLDIDRHRPWLVNIRLLATLFDESLKHTDFFDERVRTEKGLKPRYHTVEALVSKLLTNNNFSETIKWSMRNGSESLPLNLLSLSELYKGNCLLLVARVAEVNEVPSSF